jgi:hypothetical protein
VRDLNELDDGEKKRSEWPGKPHNT